MRSRTEAASPSRRSSNASSRCFAPAPFVAYGKRCSPRAWQAELSARGKSQPDKLERAFEYMFRNDPFSGHVVIRTTDAISPGSSYRLWTTLKVPQGFALRKHAQWLCRQVGAERFRLMPAKRLFTLGVGHVRRRGLEPGARAEQPAQPLETSLVKLSDLEWRVLVALKREFAPARDLARLFGMSRAREAGVDFATFVSPRSLAPRARRHRTVLDFPRTRETDGRQRARDAL